VNLKGSFTALYTPFAADGTVDLDAYEALCHRLIEAGVGLVPCGTTGETPTLSDAEYDACVSTAVRVSNGRLPVIAGTGSNCTAKTIKITRRAKELGADVALVVTPYYNKPPQSSLLAHFTMVADEGGLPVMLYNVPGRTACNMSAATSLELAEHKRIIAVKEASGNMDQIQEICLHAPDGFSVFSGDDAFTLPLIQAGGHGVVSVAGNVAPAQVHELVSAALAGDMAAARDKQRMLLPLFKSLFCTANPIPVKRAASLLGHCHPRLRLPLKADECTETMTEELKAAMVQAGCAL
jgi:4-hydroxy-tetrahydrodipicolinate synthase